MVPVTQSVLSVCVVSAATRAPKKASHVRLEDQCVETCDEGIGRNQKESKGTRWSYQKEKEA